MTAPAGWTQVGTQIAIIAGSRLAVFYKRAASESGSYTFTTTSSSFGSGIIAAYSGAGQGTFLDCTSAQTGPTTATSISAPSITTVTNNARLVVLYGGNFNGSWTQPSGTAQRATQADGLLFTVSIDDENITPAGGTPTPSSSKGAGNAPLAAFSLALRPPTVISHTASVTATGTVTRAQTVSHVRSTTATSTVSALTHFVHLVTASVIATATVTRQQTISHTRSVTATGTATAKAGLIHLVTALVTATATVTATAARIGFRPARLLVAVASALGRMTSSVASEDSSMAVTVEPTAEGRMNIKVN